MESPVKNTQGYTLIELLVVIIIISILTAAAVPTYKSYIRVAHRSDAHIAIQNLVTLQERWMAQFNRYTDNVSDLLGSGATKSPEEHYTVSIVHQQLTNASDCSTAATSASSSNQRIYTIIAMPLSASQQGDADCTCIFITNVGFRGSTGARIDADECW